MGSGDRAATHSERRHRLNVLVDIAAACLHASASLQQEEHLLSLLVFFTCLRDQPETTARAVSALRSYASRRNSTVAQIARQHQHVLACRLTEALPENPIPDLFVRFVFGVSRRQFFHATLKFTVPYIFRSCKEASLKRLAELVRRSPEYLAADMGGYIFSSIFMEVPKDELGGVLAFFREQTGLEPSMVIQVSALQILYQIIMCMDPDMLDQKQALFKRALELIMKHLVRVDASSSGKPFNGSSFRTAFTL